MKISWPAVAWLCVVILVIGYWNRPASAVVPVGERQCIGGEACLPPPVAADDMAAAMSALRYAVRRPDDLASAVAAAKEIIRLSEATKPQPSFPLVSDIRLEDLEKRIEELERWLEPPQSPEEYSVSVPELPGPPPYRCGEPLFPIPPGPPCIELRPIGSPADFSDGWQTCPRCGAVYRDPCPV